MDQTHHHHHYFHIDKDLADLAKTVVQAVLEQNKKLNKIMAALEDLQAKVETSATVTDSAVILLKGLKDALDKAGTDPAKLKALSDQLGTNTQELADAIKANTPEE